MLYAMTRPAAALPLSSLSSFARACLLGLGLAGGLGNAAWAQADASPTAAPAAQLQAAAGPLDGVAGSGISLSWSAFGSIGWAQAGQAVRYQRFIDRNGTFERDSLLGAQLDAQITPKWSATLQARLAPAVDHDAAWDLSAAWVFVAWRPDNDWLLRAGKLRAPLFLRSEHLDIGQTYDEARLPTELYGLAPSNDFTGGSVARTLAFEQGDLTLEAYHGSAGLTKRLWLREGLPGQVPAGALFRHVDTTVRGLVGTWREPTLTMRLGVHYALTRHRGSERFLVRPSFAALGPGIGYWQTSAALPGPGVETTDRISNLVLSMGAEARLDAGWRVAGEYGMVRQHHTELGVDASSGYLAVYRALGAFTPYVSVAFAEPTARSANWVHELESTTVPGAVPGAAQLNASMRLGADTQPVNRQQAVSVGTSWSPGPGHKVKTEWSRARLRISQMLDLQAGQAIEQRRTVDVWSLSYHVVF
jgi:hypothetical protein